MSKSLAERFARDKGAPQKVSGQLVHAIYRRTVDPGEIFQVSMTAHKLDPVQGLCLKVDQPAKLEVNEVESQEIVLWSDTAPEKVKITVAGPSEAPVDLRIWNCWRGYDDSVDAWLGDAGIVIAENDGRVELLCSDGRPGFSPTDLQVEIVF